MMTALRNRLVTEQDGQQHVSSVLLSTAEIPEALASEIALHELGGWDVTRYGASVRFQKQATVRWVWVRSRPPLDDNLDPN